MTCPSCGSNDIIVQAVAENKKRGCLAAGLWILLAICPILMRKGSKVRSWAVCQTCGNRWAINKPISVTALNAPRFETLAPNAQSALQQILKQNVEVSENEKDWQITKSDLKYTLESKVSVDGNQKNLLMEIEFEDDLFQSYNVPLLQIDGNTIDF